MTADTDGTEQTTATLIYIYGPPASGKLTVATRLSELTGIPLFHNHLTVNAVLPVFAFGSPPFVEAVRAMRRAVFEQRPAPASASSSPTTPRGLSPTRAAASRAAAATRAIMAGHGGRTVFVRLTAPQSALVERWRTSPGGRIEKLLDADRLRELLADFDASPLHPDDLVDRHRARRARKNPRGSSRPPSGKSRDRRYRPAGRRATVGWPF